MPPAKPRRIGPMMVTPPARIPIGDVPIYCAIYDGPGFNCWDCCHNTHGKGITTRQLTGQDSHDVPFVDDSTPNDHRVLTAEYATSCPRDCGRPIKPGQLIVRDPTADSAVDSASWMHQEHLEGL